MSLFFRRSAPQSAGRQEVRSNVTLPSYLFGGAQTYADIQVDTADSSLQSIAVHATVDLISSLTSELPVEVYSGTGPDRRKRPTPGYLLDPAGDGHGLPDWSYQVLMSWLLRGNLYGDVLDRRGGYPVQVALHHPDEVSGWIADNGEVVWAVNGRVADPATFLHRRVNPMPGRVQGASPVALHASQIGLTLTTTRFGLQWFQDGAHPGGLLTNDQVDLADPDQAKTAKERFLAALRGNREPVVLGKGWKYQPIQVTAEESQFLATQRYSEAQCARIFGPGFAEILGYDSGASMTYANVVDRDVHILKYALDKWFKRLERLLSEMLPAPQYARIDRDAMLATATLARYQAHQAALQNRWKTVNEVRAEENLTPVAWGDEPNVWHASAGDGGLPQTPDGNAAAGTPAPTTNGSSA